MLLSSKAHFQDANLSCSPHTMFYDDVRSTFCFNSNVSFIILSVWFAKKKLFCVNDSLAQDKINSGRSAL